MVWYPLKKPGKKVNNKTKQNKNQSKQKLLSKQIHYFQFLTFLPGGWWCLWAVESPEAQRCCSQCHTLCCTTWQSHVVCAWSILHAWPWNSANHLCEQQHVYKQQLCHEIITLKTDVLWTNLYRNATEIEPLKITYLLNDFNFLFFYNFFRTLCIKSCYKNWPVSQYNLYRKFLSGIICSLTHILWCGKHFCEVPNITQRKECIKKKVRFYPHLHAGQPCRQGHTVDRVCSVDGTWQIVTLSL